MSTAPPPAAVSEYLASIEGERGTALRVVFDVVHGAMPEGFRLGMAWGMIAWEVPLEVFPDTYNKKPLAFAALAAQKNYNALYLNCLYSDSAEDTAFRSAWAKTGKKLDMGKSCLRFKNVADVELDLIASTIAGTPLPRFLDSYRASR